MSKLSIINLETTKQTTSLKACTHAFDELEISSLLKIKPHYISGKAIKFKAVDFFVTDLPTIHHRLEIFDDLLQHKEIYQLLVDILPIICSLREVSQRQEEPYKFIEYLYCIRDVELYIDSIINIHDAFTDLKTQIKSDGLNTFFKYIKNIHDSEEFQALKSELKSMSFHIKPIRSITVGINLDMDAGYDFIDDMGILSINEYRIRDGRNILERIQQRPKQDNDVPLMRRKNVLEMAKDKAMQIPTIPGSPKYITPINSIYNRLDKVSTDPIFDPLDGSTRHEFVLSFKNSINTVLKKTFKQLEFEVSEYVKTSTDFLADLLPEICFLISGVDFINEMKDRLVICKPKISENQYGYIKGLKNPHLLTSKENKDIKGNEINFDENGMLYILTGANSGGKSVFLQSVGISQALFQLGLYIPAAEAVMTLTEHISVYFPNKATMHDDGGRLEQECKMISEAIKEITNTSFVLMDETFSSTSAYDASILAESILSHLASIGCKGIFSTHIHDLDKAVKIINESEKSVVKVDSLVTLTEDGKRIYNVSRRRSEGHSHAKDIARKYGLLFE